MDDIPSTPPPSYSPPASHSLVTIVAPIPPTIPRPLYLAPAYTYHGLPFDLLPPDIQSFLTSHGLGDADNNTYSTESVASLRLWLTDQLVSRVRSVCEAIAHATVRYNLLRTMYPASDPALCLLVNLVHQTFLPMLDGHMAAHLALADALVWADVTAREGGPDALTTEQALHYRWLQTQPSIELVATHLVELYEWSATMWMMGWRSDGSTTYLRPQPASEAVVSDAAASPELEGLEDAPSVFELELASAPAEAELPRPDTPGCTTAPLPVEAPPSRPTTPQSSISPPQTPLQSPRSLRRVGSPPARQSPPQCIPRTHSFSTLQSPTKPKPTGKGRYASLSLGRTLPPWWDAAWKPKMGAVA